MTFGELRELGAGTSPSFKRTTPVPTRVQHVRCGNGIFGGVAVVEDERKQLSRQTFDYASSVKSRLKKLINSGISDGV